MIPESMIITRVIRNLALLNGFHSFCLVVVAHAYRAPWWLVMAILATAILVILPAFRLRLGRGNAYIPSYSSSRVSSDRPR